MKTSAGIFFKKKNDRVLFLLLILLLSSCALVERKEEKPPFRETGVASWYGPGFNGKPTASGDIYNIHKKTAAHRFLPFGTLLKITNLDNGKSTVVTVNDRGPFSGGRDIDLSYAAAREIGLVRNGTAMVGIEVEGRDPRYIKSVAFDPKGRRGPYTIQAGSFSDESNAKRLQSILRSTYEDVYIMRVAARGGGLFRVRIGKFKTRDDALETANRLAREGYGALITTFVRGHY